ncbi:MAG: zf-HC2 domain-containing protein [Acidobacteriaceae bacterium]|nr:zf-HC2 domain-containing protein [Acidobacteriaceae bacterium]
MTKDGFCSYGNAREQALMGYLYDEMSPDELAQFDRHLSGCLVCRAELDSLTAVRSEMGAWQAPVPAGQIAVRVAAVEPAVEPRPVLRPRHAWQRTWSEIPAWAQAAAAVLVIGASAGLANLDVSYGAGGLSVRTGWRHQAAPVAVAAVQHEASPLVPNPVVASVVTDAPGAMPVATIESVPSAATAASASASASDDEAMLRRVRALVQESEKRQQRELALRLAEYTRESQSQRQADLVRIDQTLGLYQRNTGMEVLRTQQQLNSLVQRVSEQR